MTKVIGKINLNFIIWVFGPPMMFAPLYTYHMAVKNHQEPPYPHATITSTACHYPQDIIFRFIMLISSSFLALSFFISFRWAQWQANRIGFHQLPKWLFYLAQFSIICYGITIGTIDQKGIGKLHGPCAVTFFVIWFISLLNLTFYMIKMRQFDTSVIGWWSLFIKTILVFYLIGIWVYCLVNMALQQSENHQDIYVVIL